VWLIPASYQPYIFVAVVAIVASVVRRYARWGWLIIVWLGSTGLLVGVWVIYVYHVSPLSPQETRSAALSIALAIGLLFLVVSGMVVWLVAVIVLPRSAPEEAPSTGAPGRPEDTHELLGLPQRYQELLVVYREARQQAVGRPWYRTVFSGVVPSYVRQDVASTLQLWRTPDVFRTDFVATAPVLTALSEMPTARLSALEAYHRVNLTRVRRRLGPVRVIAGALPAVTVVASRVLPSVTTNLATWDAVRTSILAFVAQRQYEGLMSFLVGIGLGFIIGATIVWWMQRRLEVVGELLTIALAQRRVEAFGDTGSGWGPRPGERFDR
jgi:hypothetical protein